MKDEKSFIKYLTENLITFFLIKLRFFVAPRRENSKAQTRKTFPPHRARKANGQSRSCAKVDDEKRWKNWAAAWWQRRCEQQISVDARPLIRFFITQTTHFTIQIDKCTQEKLLRRVEIKFARRISRCKC